MLTVSISFGFANYSPEIDLLWEISGIRALTWAV